MKRKSKKKYDNLMDQYVLLSMRADKRLQRLEKYAKRPGMGELLKGAYARAMRDIEAFTGKGHKRFLTKMKNETEADIMELKAKINAINTFLRADTSTLKPGIDTRGFAVSSYEKAAATFNSRYGTSLTWQEISNFYTSKKAEWISKRIKSSKSLAKAIGKFKELNKKNPKLTGAELKRQIKANPNIKLDDDLVTDKIMKQMINMGISPRTLFKG